jgi:hypothetical protein
MVDVAIVADLGGFADDDSHAVVDDEAAAELRGGMNLDSRQPARDVRRESPKKIQVVGPQPVRQAVPHDRMHARVAKQYFNIRSGGGIPLSIAAQRLTQEHVSHATFPL